MFAVFYPLLSAEAARKNPGGDEICGPANDLPPSDSDDAALPEQKNGEALMKWFCPAGGRKTRSAFFHGFVEFDFRPFFLGVG